MYIIVIVQAIQKLWSFEIAENCWQVLMSGFVTSKIFTPGVKSLNLTINILLGAFFWNTSWYFCSINMQNYYISGVILYRVTELNFRHLSNHHCDSKKAISLSRCLIMDMMHNSHPHKLTYNNNDDTYNIELHTMQTLHHITLVSQLTNCLKFETFWEGCFVISNWILLLKWCSGDFFPP